MNQPFVIKLPKVENKSIDFNEKNELSLYSSVINYPLFKLGFHSYIHRTRSAMEITKNLQTKTNFYFVVNPYESEISNYEDDIEKSSKLYFNSKTKEISNDFLKFWEMFFVFDIINKNTKNVFIESKIDINDIIDFFNSKLETKYKTSLAKSMKKDMDVIIFNNDIKTEDENFIEQAFYLEFVNQAIEILKNLSDGGNAIIKFYDSFTIVTIKLLYILSSFFEDAIIYKPFVSRQSDTDRFLILTNFKNKNTDKIIKAFENIIKTKKEKENLVDIIPDIIISKEFMNAISFINKKLVNNQQIMINEIIKYIKENNYFGDKYHIFRDRQIESSKWWIKNFYPPSENLYEKNKDELNKLYKNTQDKLKMELEKFNESVVN
jgi:23S rRNA U2552 (ribose-2'-O)-methylase RlmE/FtsJ